MKKLTILFLLISISVFGQTGKTTLQETERNRVSLTGGEYFRIATPGANWKLDIDSLLDFMRDSISAAGGSSLTYADTLTNIASQYDIQTISQVVANLNDIALKLATETVGDAQGEAAAHNLVPGYFYKITDPGGFTGSFIILQASTDSTLSTTGTGKFINGVMTNAVNATMEYDLSIDFIISVLAAPSSGSMPNYIWQDYNGNANIISNFPFDNSNYIDNKIGDVNFISLNATVFAHNNIENLVNLDIENGSNVIHLYAEYASSITIGSVSSCNTYYTIVRANATFTITNNHTITSCIVGPGKSLDLTNIISGVTFSGRELVAGKSTFLVTSTTCPGIDPDGSKNIDMTNCQWAGELYIYDCSNPAQTISNFPSDHPVTLNPGSAQTLTILNAGNIEIPAAISGSSDFTGNNHDFCTFEADPWDPSTYVRIINYQKY